MGTYVCEHLSGSSSSLIVSHTLGHRGRGD